MVRRRLGGDPLSGQGFVFIKRRCTQLKCLYFDTGGYCVWSKRLERGRFSFSHGGHSASIALSHAQFEALLEGLDFVVRKRRQRWSPGVRRRGESGRIST